MAAFGTEIKEKIEKQKSTQNIKHIPKDAQVIMSILKELNITDYEPRVINQLLEFTYRYVTCILDDAKVYANHGKKKAIDLDDVKLASQMLLDRAFTTPPPRDVLFELARSKNVTPLPFIKPHCGLRLPPDRYCLTSCNYKLRAASQLKKMKRPTESILNKQFKPIIKTEKSTVVVKRPGLIQPVTKIQMPPKPVFKFSTAAPTKPVVKIESGIKMEMDDDILDSNKRKREEDDFELV